MKLKIDENEFEQFSKIDPFDCDKYGGIVSCIGDNTGHSKGNRDFSIAEGYKTCVDILYYSLRNSSEFYKLAKISPLEDTLVYPFWFSSRHCIELMLKLSVKRIYWVWTEKNVSVTADQNNKYEKALSSHNIKELSEIFEELVVIDEDTKNAFSEMKYFKNLVSDYFFDEMSDAFRYTFKQNQIDVNLENKHLINLTILYEKFSKVYNYLYYFCFYVFNNVYEDYKTTTFTKKLNRNQIEEISKMLPTKSNWTSQEFTEIKNEILQKFNISSKEFSKTLNLIIKHPEFSANIGEEIKFKNIRTEVVKLLCDLIKINKEIDEVPYLAKCYTKNGFIVTSIDDKLNYTHKNYLIVQKLEEKYDNKEDELFGIVTNEELAILLTFKELGQLHGYHSEDIILVFDSWNKSIISADYASSKLSRGYNYILKGLKMCGQITYLKIFNEYLKD